MNNEKASSSSFNPTASGRPNKPDLSEDVVLRGGDRVLIRPLLVGDVELERHFIEALSPTSRRFRFLRTMHAPSDALLAQLTVLDPNTDAAFVAVIRSGVDERAVGVGRFGAGHDRQDCEFALTVADDWQNKGLATHLMRRLMEVARVRGIARMHSSDAADNVLMRKFAAHLHLEHEIDPDDATLVRYSVGISASPH